MRLPAASALLGLAGLALLAGACAKNPLASSLPSSGSNGWTNRPAELYPAAGLYFAPQSPTNNNVLSLPSVTSQPASGTCILDYGGFWTVYQTDGAVKPAAPNYDSASVWLTNGTAVSNPGTSKPGPVLPVMGQSDAFSSDAGDNYVRFAGYFTGTQLPNPSTDYCQLQIFYLGANGPGIDVSSYHGFYFFTRGTGNFTVNVLSGCQCNVPPQSGPYIQNNFYLEYFNTALTASNAPNGFTPWKQVTVYFTDLQQLYGVSTPLNQVLQNFYGLQFSQQAPVSKTFWLDVDYIRFF